MEKNEETKKTKAHSDAYNQTCVKATTKENEMIEENLIEGFKRRHKMIEMCRNDAVKNIMDEDLRENFGGQTYLLSFIVVLYFIMKTKNILFI